MTKERAGEIWDAFCFCINDEDKNSLEKKIQKIVKILFKELGWSIFNEETIPQKEIRIDAQEKIFPNITIKNDIEEIIVIELKKNSTCIAEETEQQLFAYMHQLKVKFGMFIGENLQFYYESSDNEDPIKVFETDFSPNNEKAAEFISLISSPFEENKILNFCKKRILTEDDKEPFEKLKTEITDGIFNNKVKDLFIASLQKEYNEQIANNISNEIEVKISLKNTSDGKGKASSGGNWKNRKKNAPAFNFDMVNIKPGTVLVFKENEKLECIVEDNKYVQYKKEKYSLTRLAGVLIGIPDVSFQGPKFFKVKGEKETLAEKRKRME